MIKTCLILSLLKISMQCTVPSFENNIIKVNGDSIKISGCISPDTIPFEGTISTITAKNQDIKNLNYGAVQGISSPFRIDFFNTSIEIIREGAFLDLPQLHRIFLVGNEIFWISENAFQDLQSLTEVYLDYNKITDVSPRAFNNLPDLVTVSIFGNQLEHFEQAWFYRTPALQFLSLGQNRLRKIPRGAFTNLPAIRELWFIRNEIEFVDKDAFKGLGNLITLNLAENKLKSFEFNFAIPVKFMRVIIDNNNITYISDKILDVIRPKLSVLTIADNPLQCACLDKIIQWSNAYNINVPQREFQQAGAVCIIPKTKPSQCLERSDDDFQKGFWVSFARERTPTQVFDYLN
ncbi:carboxypeptidase N subunit 2-like [Photinus pyralis]|uniref:carboxypeptidase N subunit 2-like n=1 Tax=Photinus pyralis TaxID=7054 RepID=UPI00126762DD|nr:carboxypeptidase N subunit 2-like [Photinus pyralis]